MQVKFSRNVTRKCNQVATIININKKNNHIKKGIIEPHKQTRCVQTPPGFRTLHSKAGVFVPMARVAHRTVCSSDDSKKKKSGNVQVHTV